MKPFAPRRLALLAAVALVGLAPTVTALADTVLIRGATVFTMGSQGTLENADLLVTDNTINRIGSNLSAPDGALVVAAEGRPVTPGLFAGISGIGIGEVPAVSQSMDATNAMPGLYPEFDVTLAYNPNSSLVPVARVEGHTFTLLSANSGGSIIAGQGRVVALDGGYDSFHGNGVLQVSLGRGASELTGGSRAAQWLLLDQAIEETVRPPAQGEDALLTRAGRQVLQGYATGSTVVFSVNRADDILRTIRFAQARKMRAVIEGGAEAWMVAGELAAAGVPVLLDPLRNLPGNFDMIGARMDNAALLHAAGVTLSFNDGASHNARKLRQMAGNAASYGLPKEAALAALTIEPARIFGVARNFGSLEEGKRADLVLWSGDPLEVTSLPDLVIVNGKVDSLESRQTKLRDRYLVTDSEMPRAYQKP